MVCCGHPAVPEQGRSRLSKDEIDGFDEPFGEGGIGLDGGLEAVPGFEDGGGAGVELAVSVGGDGFAHLGGIGALEGGNGDLEAREVIGRAVVAQVGDEPTASGVVIDGAEELAEALGTGMLITPDAVDGAAVEAGVTLDAVGIACRVGGEVVFDLDG